MVEILVSNSPLARVDALLTRGLKLRIAGSSLVTMLFGFQASVETGRGRG